MNKINIINELCGLKARLKIMEQTLYYSEETGFEDACTKMSYLLEDVFASLNKTINNIEAL